MSKPITEMQDLSAALVGLVASAAPSVVSVSSNHSQSSGFIWQTGLVVTADEALPEDGEYTVGLWNGDAVTAQLVGRDSTTDIALLRVAPARGRMSACGTKRTFVCVAIKSAFDRQQTFSR